MSARDEVLARIGRAHQAAPPPDLDYADIARDYRTSSAATTADLAERLVDRLLDYKALVRRCGPNQVAAEVAAAMADRGAQRVVLPDGLDRSWLAQTEIAWLEDRPDSPLSIESLDGSDGVVTGCATAIAETGTLILDGTAGMGRRVLSLIPDYHLCVVWPEQICADVPQGIARIDITRPLTMISGPSATSDIELNRVEGVHGPRTLEVILVAEAGSG